jgi:hypothetical protein
MLHRLRAFRLPAALLAKTGHILQEMGRKVKCATWPSLVMQDTSGVLVKILLLLENRGKKIGISVKLGGYVSEVFVV